MSTRVLGDLKHVLHHVCMTLTWLSVMTEVLSLLFRSMSTPLFFMVWAMPPEGKSQCYSIQHIRQKWASNFVPEVCIWPFSAWQCLFAHIFYKFGVTTTPSNTFGMKWNANCEPDLIIQHQQIKILTVFPKNKRHNACAKFLSCQGYGHVSSCFPCVSCVPLSVVCVCLLVSLTCISSLCLPGEEMRDVKTEELRLPNEKFLVTSDVLHSW